MTSSENFIYIFWQALKNFIYIIWHSFKWDQFPMLIIILLLAILFFFVIWYLLVSTGKGLLHTLYLIEEEINDLNDDSRYSFYKTIIQILHSDPEKHQSKFFVILIFAVLWPISFPIGLIIYLIIYSYTLAFPGKNKKWR